MNYSIKEKKPIIIISGATGTGKTASAIYLAKSLIQKYKYSAEIINFDSVQFYKDLDIASAKPSAEELSEIQHHLISIKEVNEEMNASEFVKLAEKIVRDLHNKNTIPILVGGSGFYIRAFVKGMFDSVTASKKTRDLVEKILNDEGSLGIRNRIKEVDPESFESLHHNDDYRNCRALEHWIETGTRFSDKKKSIKDPYDFSEQRDKELNILHFYAQIPKDQHLPLLRKRTESFFENDAIFDEIKTLINKGYSGNEKSLQTIGYKEVFQYLNQKEDTPIFKNKEELIERIFISTRQLVKSQKTFFKKVTPKIEFNPLTELNLLTEHSTQFLKEKVLNRRE